MSRGSLARALDQVVDRAAGVRWADLDPLTRDGTERAVTDALSVAAGGMVAPGVQDSLRAYARAGGGGSVVVPWWDHRLSAADAAMALSLLIHAWDFDDTHDSAVVHACSVALPAALSAAQVLGADGAAMLAGVVAGVEVLSRVSLAVGVQPGVIRTAGLGSLGAAAAAARTMGLDTAGMQRALSLALSTAMSPTTRQVVEDGAISKRHQPGFVVRHGVTSAFLAAEGVAGPGGWITGTHGLAAFVGDEDAAAALMTTPGWEVTRLSLKPIPACRYTHAAVDAVVNLVGGSPAPEVTHARVHLPAGSTHALVARPWRRRGQPVIDAQFSVPWLVAAALHAGFVDLTTVAGPALLDPEIEEKARRVEVILDQDAGRSLMTPVRVVLVSADGEDRVGEVREAPGSPERPLTWDSILAKATGCMRAAGRDPSMATVVRDVVLGLEHSDVRSALGQLAPASSAGHAEPPIEKERT